MSFSHMNEATELQKEPTPEIQKV